MRTNFTAEQRQDPATAEAEAELRRCVHCGFCTSACPTYAVEGNELDGPRGRITLIQTMLEQGGAPDAGTVFHLDRCLSCLSCVSACPSGVDYGHLIETGRAHIETHYKRPTADRLMRKTLGRVLPSPSLFGAALALGRIARPLAPHLPERLGAMLDLVPERSEKREVAPGRYPAEGARKMGVVLIPACVEGGLAPQIEAASIRVLTKLGADVMVPDPACCGALSQHLGQPAHAKNFAREMIERVSALSGDGADHVVMTAAGCGTQIKAYARLFAGDPALAPFAAAFSGRALDVSEAVAKLGLPAGLKPPRAVALAYQSACSLQHGQGIDALPRKLLVEAGYSVTVLPEAHLCCGSAGAYNMLEPDLSEALRECKLDAIEATGAEAVASGNIGCIAQLAPFSDLPVAHTIEWLDWAMGGPEPDGLAGI